jgi:hypothetical protein
MQTTMAASTAFKEVVNTANTAPAIVPWPLSSEDTWNEDMDTDTWWRRKLQKSYSTAQHNNNNNNSNKNQ